MMNWYGNGMNGWGYGLMTISMLLFWALVITGVVVVVRYLSIRGRPAPNALPGHRAPEEILAERFARGDIDDEEYRQRAEVLRSHMIS